MLVRQIQPALKMVSILMNQFDGREPQLRLNLRSINNRAAVQNAALVF